MHIGEATMLYTDSSGIMVATAPYSGGFGPHCVAPRKYWQEGKKVYGTIDYCIYDTTAPLWRGDTLLYFDFDITVGDTFHAYNFMGHYFDTLVVLTDDSTGYQGRRKLTFSSNYVEWVEGIGNVNNAWDSFSPTQEYSISGTTPFYCIYGDSVSFPCQDGNFVGVPEPTLTQVQTWPNPFVDEFSISMDRVVSGELSLYSASGARVYRQHIPLNSSIIKVSELGNLPSGAYLVVVVSRDGEEVMRTRVVK